MILLADGGSSTVDWRLIEGGKQVSQVITMGANPFFRTREDVSEELREKLLPVVSEYNIKSVHFFGAGCAFPDKNEIIRQAIADNIKTSYIEVGSDLIAAAKGLCGHTSGIACIIGTGSNSCYYDGVEIKDNVSPLGYVLGDEGSGAVLGRLFVGACLKNQLTKGIKERFFQEMELTPAIILDKVYKQPLANRFLADLSPFIKKNLEDKTIYTLVYNAFKEFFVRNVMQYDYNNNKVHFTGSVAYHYQEVLRDVAKDLNITTGSFVSSPMDGLMEYYAK